jgi:hypothetical protein
MATEYKYILCEQLDWNFGKNKIEISEKFKKALEAVGHRGWCTDFDLTHGNMIITRDSMSNCDIDLVGPALVIFKVPFDQVLVWSDQSSLWVSYTFDQIAEMDKEYVQDFIKT